MSINRCCEQIQEICYNEEKPYKDYKGTLMQLFYSLENKARNLDAQELDQILLTHQQVCQIRNRKAKFIEQKIMEELMVPLPARINYRELGRPAEVGILQDTYPDGERKALVLSAKLLTYAKKLSLQKDDPAKRIKKRITGAFRLLEELNNHYQLPGVKDIFEQKIEDPDPNLQFFALVGIEGYYATKGAEPIPESLVQRLEAILDQTSSRESASTCCKILIHAGKMDEFGAVIRMDDWKDKNCM